MTFECKVCGFPNEQVLEAFDICPCCGTEFGVDDDQKSHEKLRHEWIARGAHWFSRETPPPTGWNVLDQLRKAGYLLAEATASASTAAPENITVGKQSESQFEFVAIAKAA